IHVVGPRSSQPATTGRRSPSTSGGIAEHGPAHPPRPAQAWGVSGFGGVDRVVSRTRSGLLLSLPLIPLPHLPEVLGESLNHSATFRKECEAQAHASRQWRGLT